MKAERSQERTRKNGEKTGKRLKDWKRQEKGEKKAGKGQKWCKTDEKGYKGGERDVMNVG